MKKSLWMMAFVPFLLVGCFEVSVSLHPIYTEEDLIFVPELLGTWYEGEPDDETLSFSSDDHRSYDLVVPDDEGGTFAFSVHLIRIKGTMFLDLYPASDDEELFPYFMPVHNFFLVEQIEPTLKMRAMDDDWLESYLKEHPRSLRHEIVDEIIVLTASTKKLQAFLLKHMNKGAFEEEPTELTRLPPEAEPEPAP